MSKFNNWVKVREDLVDLTTTAFKESPNVCEEYNGECSKCPYIRFCRMNNVLDDMVVKIMKNDPKTPLGVQMLINPQLQELCERCLSYFWDRLSAEGIDNPDVEYLADDMGIDEEELKILFKEAGYEEE